MRTEVAIADDAALIVEPTPLGNVEITIKAPGTHLGVLITQAQAGALIFAIERAAEAGRIALERETAYLYPNGITA